MRIGIDARLLHYRMGGISQTVRHLLPALARLDKANEYQVYQMGKDGQSHAPPATNFRRRNLLTPCHHWLERWTLALELLPRRLDVWHSPDFIPPAAGARRRVITVHDLNFIYYPQFLTAESRRYYADQIAWAVRAADHIAADSHATRRDLIEQLAAPAEKVTTVHVAANPIYARPVQPESVAETLRGLGLASGYILFVGTLEPRKNLPTLLRAYHQLRQADGVDVPLLLVGGKGWIYDDIFRTIADLGLTDRVRHLAGVDDESLAHLYRAAAVLVTPSYYEGFGLPALEAMHAGCPVIVSRRGSLPEVVGDAGLLLDPDDEAAWREGIYRVLTDGELRSAMAARGRVQAERFSWDRAARQMRALYLGLDESIPAAVPAAPAVGGGIDG